MPHAPRHSRRRQHMTASARPPAAKYEIIDPNAKPDLRGQFAGVKVIRDGHRRFVNLTPNQARFYIDQGAIKVVK